MQNNVCSDIFWYRDMIYMFEQKKNENFPNLTSWTHSFAYSSIYENSKFHIFLILYPIYIKLSLFYLKYYSSYWINLNLDQISPFKTRQSDIEWAAFCQQQDNVLIILYKVEWLTFGDPVYRTVGFICFSKVML